MKTLLTILTIFTIFLFGSISEVESQDFFNNERTARTTHIHATVGTTTADAINSTDIGGNVLTWKICNDIINTSTFLAVGKASDVSDDGTRLNKGDCFTCSNCKSSTLKLMRVEGQAASNGYSVIQYRK